MNSRRTIRPKRIERSREIYKAVAADAAACGMTPKQFAEHFMEQGVGNCESSAGYLGEPRGSGIHFLVKWPPDDTTVGRTPYGFSGTILST
jgi:hypothetical protein